MIRYYSMNGDAPKVSFQEALFRGLAPDGGLYFPDAFPKFSAEEVDKLRGNSLQEVAYQVLSKWFGDEIEADALRQIAIDAQNFPMPMHKVGDTHVLDLTHGPTLAFKDVAAQNLPRLMSYFLQKEARQIKLLVATSGDTGINGQLAKKGDIDLCRIAFTATMTKNFVPFACIWCDKVAHVLYDTEYGYF